METRDPSLCRALQPLDMTRLLRSQLGHIDLPLVTSLSSPLPQASICFENA
jgi:hypothetical protein